ncbi:MAG: HD-GYP domain-containing protein [Lachnospiraceae bacterium]
MKNKGEWIDKSIDILFHLIVCGILSLLLIGFFALPNERQTDIYNCQELDTGWYQCMEDGRKKEIILPQTCQVKQGETLTLSRTLPKDLDITKMPWICFHSSLQDMQIYIDGKLRGSYSTKTTRLWGKNSVSAYYFVQLKPSDRGKTLEFLTTTDSKKYSGNISMVYAGTVFGIYINTEKENAFEIISAILLVFLAFATIIMSNFLRVKLHRKTYLSYLGWTVLLLAIWILSESPMRQFYCKNMSLLGNMTHLAVYTMAIPVFLFYDYVQKHRYAKVYRPLLIAEIVFAVTAATLEITGVTDFSVLFYIALLIHFAGAVCIFVTFFSDVKKGYAKNYRLIGFGFLGFVIGVFSQIVLYMQKTRVFHGVALCIGTLFWLAMSVLSVIRDYLQLEKENVENRVKAQKLSWQAMQTLVQTIEAKDTYTKGHSTRVAKYSALLAEKMGMSEKQQKEIYYMGMLHDIGKIGIADNIINKPGKLTDEEYAVIKTHPVIGYQILKNMDEIKGIEYGARWHHERYDGKGYPDGLVGEQIPIYARIIAVADMYDAMTSNRSYRKVVPQKEVRAEIVRVSGSQLDPQIAACMLQLIDEDTEYQLRQ